MTTLREVRVTIRLMGEMEKMRFTEEQAMIISPKDQGMTRFMGMMVKTSLVRAMEITRFMAEVIMTQSPVEREMIISKAITEMTLLILEKEKIIS